MAIIVAILGVLMVFAGLLPPIAEIQARDRLNEIFHHPKSLEIRLDGMPSAALLWGQLGSCHLSAREFALKGVDIQQFDLATTPISLNIGALTDRKVQLLSPVRAEFKGILTLQSINTLLQSEKVAGMINAMPLSMGEIPGFGSLEDVRLRQVQVVSAAPRLRVTAQAVALGGFLVIPVELSGVPKILPTGYLTLGEPAIQFMGNEIASDQAEPLLSQMWSGFDPQSLSPAGASLSLREVAVREDSLQVWGDVWVSEVSAGAL